MEWSSKMELRLSELYDRYGNDYRLIGSKLEKEFGREYTYHSVRNKIRRSSIIEYQANKRGQGIFANLKDEEQFNNYTEAKDKIKSVMRKFDKKYGDKEVDILTISDLHVPKTDLDALEKVLLDNQDCEVCLIAGDLLDYKSISHYGNKKEITVEEEYKMGFEILKQISNMFEYVVVIDGNHEARLKRFYSSKIITALSGYLDDKHKPLSEITRFFDNVDYISAWFAQIGDLLISHPSRYSKVNMRTVRNVVEDRIEKGHEEEFAPFNTVICGHTHRAGKALFNGVTSCEIGCLEQLDVEFRHQDSKGKRWVHACGRVEMNNGKTTWNDIQVIHI